MPLNKNQKAAVEYLEGPLLVLAGPGTGKTQLLSSKVEYILKNTDANPENILDAFKFDFFCVDCRHAYRFSTNPSATVDSGMYLIFMTWS